MFRRISSPASRLVVLLLALTTTSRVYATTTGTLPWDNILGTLADSASGPVIGSILVMATVAGGAYWAFTDSQQGLVRIFKVLMVGAIVSGLTAFFAAFGITTSLV